MRLWLPKRRSSAFPTQPAGDFTFLQSPAPLRDGELELVEPSPRLIDAVLLVTGSPACAQDPGTANLTRADLLRFVDLFPRGRQRPNLIRQHAPGYTFWMRLRGPGVPCEMAGSVSLRIGADDTNLVRYLGHIGYGVHPPARGRRLAERATRLLYPLAKAHGMRELWITANPDNHASRRTCERLGGELIDIVDLPPGHPLYERGERQKCRYRCRL